MDANGPEQFATVSQPGAKGLHTILNPQDIEDTELADVQNMVYDGGALVPRKGFSQLFAKPNGESATQNTLATSKTSDGVDFLIAIYGTNFYLWDPSNKQTILLNTGSGISYTYTPSFWSFVTWNAGTGTDVMYFANGRDTTTKWQISLTTLAVAAASADTSVTLTDGTRFPSSGTLILQAVGGSQVTKAWTSKTGTNQLNFGSSLGSDVASGASATIALSTVSAVPTCSILQTFQRRLFAVGGYQTESVINYSKVNTPEDFSTTTGVTGAGAETLADGQGPITAVVDSVGFILIGKTNNWSQFAFIYSSDVTTSKLVQLNEVASGRSIGTLNQRTILKSLGSFDYISQTDGIYSMSLVSSGSNSSSSSSAQSESVSFQNLSEKINDRLRTGGIYYFDNATSIYWAQKGMWAVGTSSGAKNTVVLLYDYLYQYWTVITGWNVQAWGVYNDNLYFLSNGDGSVNQAFTGNQDGSFGYKCSFTTKRFDFGDAALPKTIDKAFIQGMLDSITNLEVDAYWNENGILWSSVFHITGTSVYVLRGNTSGVIGADTLDSVVIGGSKNAAAGTTVAFRTYLDLAMRFGFHNLQFTFSTNQIGATWSINKIGFNPQKEATYPSALVLSPG